MEKLVRRERNHMGSCKCSKCKEMQATSEKEWQAQQKGFHSSVDEMWHKLELADYNQMGEHQKQVRRKEIQAENQKVFSRWPEYKKQEFIRWFARVSGLDQVREYDSLIFCEVCRTFDHDCLEEFKE